MNFIACAVAVFPRQLLEFGTDIRATVRSRYGTGVLDPSQFSYAAALSQREGFRLVAVVGFPHNLQQFFVRKSLPLSL